MKEFKQQLYSPHSPEDTWEVLKTPIWSPLSAAIYPHLSVSYIYLDVSTHLLQNDSRVIIRPSKKEHRQQAQELQLPSSISMKVTELSDNRRRDDFTDNQIVSGWMERRVEPAIGSTSMLIIEGEFALNGTARLLTTLLQIKGHAPERFIFESNQKILNLTPQILADHKETQSRRHSLVSN